MARNRFYKSDQIQSESLDPSIWPNVLIDQLDESEKAIYLRRKKAVELYLKGEKLLVEITTITGIHRVQIYQLTKRCLETDPYGEIWGFRALIPYKRIQPYHKKHDLSNDTYNDAGAFTLLLNKYPTIEDTILNYYSKNYKKGMPSQFERLHRAFIDACRAVGLTASDYPLNTVTNARKSLQKYVKNLGNERKDSREELREQGFNISPIVRPFQRVQFDGHRIDTAISIVFRTPEGDEIVETMNRIWLLVIIDVGTRAILGHHLCLNKEYSAKDVLQCIRNAVVPWTPKSLTISGLTYASNGNFPSNFIEEAQWGLWDEFLYDNARANLSNIVRDRLTQIIGCSVNAGPVRVPERRAIAERFFRTIEDNGFHKLPSTTGSNPRDPLRKNAEEQAIKYQISASHIEEVTDVLIANYNGTPHEGINNLTPLEAIQQRVSRGMLIRQMPEEQRNEVKFFSMKATRVIRGNKQFGKRPHINFEGVTYHNEILSRSYDLIGETLTLLVNTDDVRSVNAYLPDGSEFGVLTALGKWGVSPHDLKTRKLINKLRNRKMINVLNEDDPVEVLQRHLEAESKKKKNARNTLSTLNRYLEKHQGKNSNAESDSREEEDEMKVLKRDDQEEEREKKASSRRLKKTISY